MIHDLTNKDILLNDIVKILNDGDTILLDNKTYFEKIKIEKKNITIIGKENSCIAFDDYNGRLIPLELGGDGIKKYGTTGSATFTVEDTASYFTCKNVTFKNTFDRGQNRDGQAVCFKSESHYLNIDNCRFISGQDTLYVDFGTKNKITNSYIEGDVDFIFGSADCIFDNCKIVGKKGHDTTYFIAPSTYIINNHGFIFNNCEFYSANAINTYLGRPWYPGGAQQPVYPKASFINCKFNGHINMYLLKMHSKDPDGYQLKFNNCYHNDKLLNNDDVTFEKKYI
ncbi:MAG: hypothetical protein IJY14_02810 [Acholeplasmatales bacterium]|nr:hypothetical protein [Acholeplasmatales bacterium]